MSEAVPEVKTEGRSGDGLDGNLESEGQRAKGSGHAGSINSVTKSGQSDVAQSVEVESTTQSDTSDTVKTRKDHGDFRLVDGKVGGDGSVGALLLQDLKGLGISGRDGGDWSERVRTSTSKRGSPAIHARDPGCRDLPAETEESGGAASRGSSGG